MKKTIKVSIFFIISYIVSQMFIYFFSKENFFTSPMYILLPIVGFFVLFFLTPVVEKYTECNFYIVLLAFVIISLIAQYLVIYIYAYQIYVVLNNMEIPKGMITLSSFLNYSFFTFVISGVFGMFASKKKIL